MGLAYGVTVVMATINELVSHSERGPTLNFQAKEERGGGPVLEKLAYKW